MRLIMCLLALLIAVVVPARADGLAPADEAAIRGVITDQIEAFRADDAARAYSHAAPVIRQIFPDAQRFMGMVRQGYQPVYRPRAYSFEAVAPARGGEVVQHVRIVGPDGLDYMAVYTLERQPDGSWQITGCSLVKAPGVSA